MRVLVLSLLFLAAACSEPVLDVSQYQDDPDRRHVTIDGKDFYVSPQQFNRYAAWGNGTDKWAKYHQRRAIELVSHCLVDEVISKPTDTVVYAHVKC